MTRYRGVLIAFAMISLLCAAIIALGPAPPLLNCPAPTIPPYPNAIGEASYPGGWELRVLGEAFGGFSTSDSPEAVSRYYRERLTAQGWRDGWYQNWFGYCYTLLIIPNPPGAANAPPKTTQISVKLRQAFRSELGTTAPAGCK